MSTEKKRFRRKVKKHKNKDIGNKEKQNEALEKLKNEIGSGPWDDDFRDFPGPSYSFYYEDYKFILTRCRAGSWDVELILPKGHFDIKTPLKTLNENFKVHGSFRTKNKRSVEFGCAAKGDIVPADRIMHTIFGKDYPPSSIYRDFAFAKQETIKAIQQFQKREKGTW